MTVYRVEYKGKKLAEFLEHGKAMDYIAMAVAYPARVGIERNAKSTDFCVSAYELAPRPLIDEAQVKELMKHVGGDSVVAADMASGKVTIHFSSEKIQTNRGWFDAELSEMVGEEWQNRPCDKEISYIYERDVDDFLELR
jgi:hypothetical protein